MNSKKTLNRETIVPKSASDEQRSPTLRRGKDFPQNETKSQSPKTRALDGGWGWIVVLASFANTSMASTLAASYTLIFSPYFHDHKVSDSTASWIFNLNQFTWNLSSILVGPLVSKYGWRKVSLFGSFLMSMSMVANVFIVHSEALFITYSLFTGLGQGLSVVTSIVIVATYFDKKKGLATGITSSGFCAGIFIGPLIVRVLVGNYGYKGSFLILGAILTHSFICSMVYHPIEWHSKTLPTSVEKQLHYDQSCKEQGNDPAAEGLLLNDNSPSTSSCRTDDHLKQSTQSNSSLNIPSKSAKKTPIEGISSAIIMISTISLQESLVDVPQKTCLSPEEPTGLCMQQRQIFKQVFKDILLLKRSTVQIIAVGFAFVLASYTNFLMMFPFAMANKGYSWDNIAWCMSVAGMGNFVGRLIVAVTVDSVPFSTKYFFIFGSLGIFLSMIMVSLVDNYGAILFFMASFGFSLGVCVCVLALVVLEFAGLELLPRVLGLIGLLTSVFFLCCGPLIGFLHQFRNAFNLAIQIISAAPLFGFSLFCLLSCAVVYDKKNSQISH